MVNFGTYHVQVHKYQVVAQLPPYPTTITQGPFIIGEFLWVVNPNSEDLDLNSTGDNKKNTVSEDSLTRQDGDALYLEKENLRFTPLDA